MCISPRMREVRDMICYAPCQTYGSQLRGLSQWVACHADFDFYNITYISFPTVSKLRKSDTSVIYSNAREKLAVLKLLVCVMFLIHFLKVSMNINSCLPHWPYKLYNFSVTVTPMLTGFQWTLITNTFTWMITNLIYWVSQLGFKS